MQNANNGWWLYATDIELARKLQWECIDMETNLARKAKLISMTTYLGDYARCESEINRLGLTKFVDGRHALCRARRARNSRKTWAALMDENNSVGDIINIINQAIKKEHTICVLLVGGIGDQLEAASLILAHSNMRRTGSDPDIRMKPKGQNNSIVVEHLKKSRAAHLLASNNENFALQVSMPMYLCWHEAEGKIDIAYEPLINNKIKHYTKPKSILMCWRCKVDPNNGLSSFSRSIPFRKIIETLIGWRQRMGTREYNFMDISEYSEEEQTILQRMIPEIKLRRQSITKIEDTMELINNCDHIVSVDTSLAHIAATSNKTVHTLHPLYFDERWKGLMENGGAYRDNIISYRQKGFNDWEHPLNLIERILWPK